MRHSIHWFGLIPLLAACAGIAGSESGAGSCKVISTGSWMPFNDPYGDGGVNQAANLSGNVSACPAASGLTIKLAVTGAAPNRMYGAHVHVLDCAAGAGGHYRNNPEAGATASNEVWLDFTTNSTGAGSASTTTAWPIATGQANSVVIHDHMTESSGAAGPKLTCVTVGF